MYGLMLTIHILICIALVIAVLLQSAKGEGLAGAFGGSSLTGTVFGGRGVATFLSKATTVLAIAFMTSCIVLSFMRPATGFSPGGVLQGESAVEEAARQGQSQPVAPAQAPVESPDRNTEPPVDPAADLFDAPAQDQGEATGQQPGDSGQ